jgi:hypothetical protein
LIFDMPYTFRALLVRGSTLKPNRVCQDRRHLPPGPAVETDVQRRNHTSSSQMHVCAPSAPSVAFRAKHCSCATDRRRTSSSRIRRPRHRPCPVAEPANTVVNRQDALNVTSVSVLRRTIVTPAAMTIKCLAAVGSVLVQVGGRFSMPGGKHRLRHQRDARAQAPRGFTRKARSSTSAWRFRLAKPSTLATAATLLTLAVVVPAGLRAAPRLPAFHTSMTTVAAASLPNVLALETYGLVKHRCSCTAHDP